MIALQRYFIHVSTRISPWGLKVGFGTKGKMRSPIFQMYIPEIYFSNSKIYEIRLLRPVYTICFQDPVLLSCENWAVLKTALRHFSCKGHKIGTDNWVLESDLVNQPLLEDIKEIYMGNSFKLIHW